MATPRFRLLPHTADARLAVWGDSEDELIRHAILGAVALAIGRQPRARPERWVGIDAWPRELDRRLVRAVNEALFWLFSAGQPAVAFRTEAGGGLLGLALPRHRIEPEIEVKAATFGGLRPETGGARARAVLILDL